MLRGNPGILLALAVLLCPMCILAGSPRETLGIAPQGNLPTLFYLYLLFTPS